jgi:NosR/NirI family nitrous oxide reductase transcriptional regulator
MLTKDRAAETRLNPRPRTSVRLKGSKLAAALLQSWRWFVFAAIVWMIRDHHFRVVQGSRPITVTEVREFLPETFTLKADAGRRAGLFAVDRGGTVIGYAARTMPHCREIIGYSGPTDALMVFDEQDRMLGIDIRHSYDTPSHVEMVELDLIWMETWNKRTWGEISEMQDLRASKVWGVSDSSKTSEALAKSIAFRTAAADQKAVTPDRFRFRWQDAGLVLVTLAGLALAFIKRPWLQKRKLWVSIGIFVYLGLISGDLLAQSMAVAWAESGIPWRVAPGLALLALAAFLVPGAAKHPVYCTHICPHGHAQRWLMKVLPARWKIRLHSDLKWGLKSIPVLLIALVLLTTFLKMPFDLAGIEPFDAYLIKSAGIVTIVVALVGLAFSVFVPMGYCKYGCPTGAILEFGRRSRFGLKDIIGALALAATFGLYFFYDSIRLLLI